MPAYQYKKKGSNKVFWYCSFYCKVNGERKRIVKRGFATKHDAKEWESKYLNNSQLDEEDMTFQQLFDNYEADNKNYVRESTWLTKENIVNKHILPFFGHMKIRNIGPQEVTKWQNEKIKFRNEKGEPFEDTYLRTIRQQLSAIFNYAVKYGYMSQNPVPKTKAMGKRKSDEMLYWTKDEYLNFSEAMLVKPISYYAFEMLYWCGIREGELLALTKKDFNFETREVSITKTFQRLKGRDVISPPKTAKGKRKVLMPEFLCEEIQEYIGTLYKVGDKERIFPVTKSYLKYEIERGSKERGVKRIRVHDLRHSHVSLLIDLGFSALAIADRVGHETADITYTYAHLFPTRQKEIVSKLEMERGLTQNVAESKGQQESLEEQNDRISGIARRV